jgi:hypothetical protein
MKTLEDFGITPAVLANIQAVADATRPVLEDTRPFIEDMRPVLAYITRQDTAMESARNAYLAIEAVDPLPVTRQALVDLFHRLPDQPLLTTAPTLSQQDAEQALLALLPETDEERDEVLQGIGEIQETPEFLARLRLLISDINWKDVGELTAWGALVWVAQRLFQWAAGLPLPAHPSFDELAALGNLRLMILAVIAALAQLIWMIFRR